MFRKNRKLNARLTPGQALQARLGKQKAKRADRPKYEPRFWGAIAVLLMPLVKLALILAVTSVLLLGAYVGLAHSSWFGLRQVEISGASHLSRLDILSAAGLGLHTNLLRLTSSQAEAGIRELPWIKQVKVERELPNRIFINVVEQTPYAIGLIEGQLFYLNHNLKPFAPYAPLLEGHILPIISGLSRAELIKEDEELEALLAQGKSILTVLQDQHKLGSLSQLDLNRSSGAKLVFEQISATIKVGPDFDKERLAVLENVVEDLKQRGELTRTVLIDLSLDKRVIVRLGQERT